jgi:hypothetical protein
VLSRDGTRMSVTFQDEGSPPTVASIVNVPKRTLGPQGNQWNFATFSPDGNELITAERGTIRVRNYANQSMIVDMPSAGYATHPDMSPDGKKLVYVRPGTPGQDWSFNAGSIMTRTYDASTHTFGPEVTLVTGGGDNFYPSWSPDGEWIAFTRTAGNSYADTSAQAWVVKADGSQPPIELAVANDGGSLTNSWGRWAPFAQTINANGEKLFWITVSSKRNFGTRLFGVGRPQLWMTPFFPNRASNQADPSAAAFRLQFQNMVSNNHIALWTVRVVVTF